MDAFLSRPSAIYNEGTAGSTIGGGAPTSPDGSGFGAFGSPQQVSHRPRTMANRQALLVAPRGTTGPFFHAPVQQQPHHAPPANYYQNQAALMEAAAAAAAAMQQHPYSSGGAGDGVSVASAFGNTYANAIDTLGHAMQQPPIYASELSIHAYPTPLLCICALFIELSQSHY